MRDIRPTISKNLAALRAARNITQAELAERLSYSNKAISRWEQGDTLPDVNVLFELCEFYGITMNDLVSEDCMPQEALKRAKDTLAYRIWTYIMVGAFVLLSATVIFVYTLTIQNVAFWQIFVMAIPVSCLVISLLGRGYFSNLVQLILGSAVVWTAIASVYCYFIVYNFWTIFLIGIPLQLIFFLRYKQKQFK